MNTPSGTANSLELLLVGVEGLLLEVIQGLGYSLRATSLACLDAEGGGPCSRQVVIIVCPDAASGAALIRRARARHRDGGIIAATHALSSHAEVLFLDAGADRCLSLPCDRPLVQASVNALVRRLLSDWSPNDDAVHLNPRECILRIGCRVFDLRRTEYRLCEYLILNRGRWVSERELLRNVLAVRHDRETSLVRVHVRHIRKAFGDLQHYVASKRGLGYQFSLAGGSVAGKQPQPMASTKQRGRLRSPYALPPVRADNDYLRLNAT